MKKAEEPTDIVKLRIIMSRHGEGLHNVAGKKISNIWKDEVARIREEIAKESGDTPEIKELLDNLVKEYRKDRDDIAYNLLTDVDAIKYKDPSLTERGKTQASYSGKALQAYVDKKELKLSSSVFSSPFERTINSLEEVLQNLKGSEQERFAIPDLMETSGRYVDTYDEDKNYGEYTVLGDGIDVQKVMKGGETEAQVVERSKKGLEKVFKSLQGKEEGLPIVMIHGGVMKAFSDEFFKGAVDKIENSDLWDLEISFERSGKFIGADLLEKVEMDDSLKKEYTTKLESLAPSEQLLDEQDFSPVENALSNLANKLQEEVQKSISDDQKIHTTLKQGQESVSVSSTVNVEAERNLSGLGLSSSAAGAVVAAGKRPGSPVPEEIKDKKLKRAPSF